MSLRTFILLVLIVGTNFCPSWCFPLNGFEFILPTTSPPPSATPATPGTIPQVVIDKNDTANEHPAFRVKFQDVAIFQHDIYDAPNLRLSFFDASKFGTYDYGSMVDLNKGYIKIPVHGLYFIQIIINLSFVSWNETESNEVSVALHSARCLSNDMWMSYSTKLDYGDMTLETSSILELKTQDKLCVCLHFPNTFQARIYSNSIISGVLIKSFSVK